MRHWDDQDKCGQNERNLEAGHPMKVMTQGTVK